MPWLANITLFYMYMYYYFVWARDTLTIIVYSFTKSASTNFYFVQFYYSICRLITVACFNMLLTSFTSQIQCYSNSLKIFWNSRAPVKKTTSIFSGRKALATFMGQKFEVTARQWDSEFSWRRHPSFLLQIVYYMYYSQFL